MEDTSDAVEASEPKDKNTIRAEYQAATWAWDKMAEEVNPIVQSLTEAEREEVGSYYSYEKQQLLIDPAEIGKIANPKVRKIVEAMSIGAPALQQRMAASEVEYKPILKEDIAELVAEVTPRVNYDPVFNSPPADQEQADALMIHRRLEGFMFLRATEKAIKTQRIDEYSFSKLAVIYNKLKKDTDQWKARGWLNDEPDPDPVEDASEGDIEKLEETVDWHWEQASIFRRLAKFYRPSSISIVKFGRDLESAFSIVFDLRRDGFLLDVTFESYSEDGRVPDFKVGVDPRLVYSLKWFINQEIGKVREETGALPQFDKRKRYVENQLDFDIEEAWRKIKIEGLEAKPGERLIITSEELIRELQKRIPSYFVKNLGSVKFTEFSGKVTGLVSEDLSDQFVFTGKHFTRFSPETGEYTHDDIEIYREPILKDEDDDIVADVKKGFILDTLVHEIAHGVHARLTLEEMQAWEKVLEDDQTALTNYVNLARNAIEHKDILGRIEDFTESMMYFANHNPTIYNNSRARCDYMANLFYTYARPEERDRINKHIMEQLSQYNAIQRMLASLEQTKLGGG